MSGIYRGPNGSATADALNIDGDKGDLTISNSGLEWTINPDTVDFSKMQNISTNTVLGRATAGTGDVEEITCTAAGRALLDDANASAQRTTLGLGNAATATIGTEVLAYDSNLQAFVNTFTLPTVDSTNGYVLTTNGSGTLSLNAPGGIADGDKGDITVTTGGTVWMIDNDVVTTAKILDDNVTYAKIQNVSATDKLLGRSTAGAGDIEEITCTSAGRALLDDADASAQRTTLGLGSLATLSTVTNAELDNQYIDDLSIVTLDPANDYVAIADASDSGNKKKALIPSVTVTSTANDATYVSTSDTNPATPSWINGRLIARVFTSADQTMTAGGLLTIAHGLGAVPKRVYLQLKCTTADGTYALNDILEIAGVDEGSAQSAGTTVRKDATNIYVRVGANGLLILNNSGSVYNPTLSNYRLIAKAEL